MKRCFKWMGASLALSLVLPSAGFAVDPPNPVFWVATDRFTAPSSIFTHANIARMMHVYTHGQELTCIPWTMGCSIAARSPEDVADELVNDIVTAGLENGPIGIYFEGYGLGFDPTTPVSSMSLTTWLHPVLSFHPDDSMPEPSPPDSDYHYWKTPWFENGITNASYNGKLYGGKEWIDDFITEYDRLAAIDSVDSPHRFHFNVEKGIEPFFGESVDMFHDMLADNRSDSGHVDAEFLRGWSTNETLKDLYDDAETAGTIPMDSPDKTGANTWKSSVNHDWTEWYIGVSRQALDGALSEAAYEPIETAWTGCKVGNTRLSLRLDGQGTPKRVFLDRNGLADNNGDLFDTYWSGSATLQSPFLYQVAPSLVSSPDTHADVAIRYARINLDAIIHSFPSGGTHEDEIAAWIPSPGWPFLGYAFDKDDCRRMFALLRSRNVPEAIFFGTPEDDSTESIYVNNLNDAWDEMPSAIDQVWGVSLNSVTKIHGTGSQTNAQYKDAMQSADRSYGTVESALLGLEHQAVFTQQYDPTTAFDSSGADALRVYFEGALKSATSDVTLEIFVKNQNTSTWEKLGTNITLPSNGDAVVEYRDLSTTDPLSNYKTGGGMFEVRLDFAATPSFEVHIDLTQMVGIDDVTFVIGNPS